MIWDYDPTENAWTSMPPHPRQSRWAPGSFVIDNKVFFTSGLSSSQLLQDVWMYEMEGSTSTNRPNKNENLKLFPNPTSDYLQFEIQEEGNTESWNLQIFDALGKEVQKRKIRSSDLIDVSSITTGQYFVTLKKGSSVYNGAFKVLQK